MSNLISNPQAPLSTTALTEALHQQVEYLLRQYGKLIRLASSNTSSSAPGTPAEESASAEITSQSLPSAAVQTYQITAETQALISSIESLTALTRRMKEAWVFGELETIGASNEAAERTDQMAREIVQGLLKNGQDPVSQEQ